MATDNRTPAEIAYDRTALSRTPADQGPFGVDANIDDMIAIFEQLEARIPEAPIDIMTKIFELLEADEPMSADEKTILDWIIDQSPAEAPEEKITPLLTFPGEGQIVGTHDEHGAPWCVRLEGEHGGFSCGPDGLMSGSWAGVEMWDIDLEQVEKLQALFNSGMLLALVDFARDWCKE